MLKKISLLLAITASLFALSFSSSGKIQQEKPKYIEINGVKYQYVIGTASKTGTYYKAGAKLATQLPDAVAAETDGSLQNLDLLDKGVINVAFVQGDAYNLWCNSHQATCQNDFAVIDTGHQEVIQIMCGPNSGVEDDGDLQSKDASIDVGPVNSGASASWDNMCLLEPNFKKAKKEFDPAMDETVIFKVKNGKVKCLMRTATWNPSNPFVQKALQAGLKFIDVEDWDLNDKININGQDKPIYDFVKVKVKYPGDFFSTTVKTIATHTYIVINKKKLNRAQYNKLLDIVNRFGSGLWN